MSEHQPPQPPEPPESQPPEDMLRSADIPHGLGVMESVSLGWALLKSDFWNLWLIALVMYLIVGAASSTGIGGIIVGPPLTAGLFLVLGRKIDGQAVQVGDVFDGFRYRFGQSIVAALIMVAFSVVATIVLVIGALVLGFGIGMLDKGSSAGLPLLLVGIALIVVALVAMLLMEVLFMPAFAAIWDFPHSGWEALKASIRLGRENLLPLLGLILLFLLIFMAAGIVGTLACGVGALVTVPASMAWFFASLTYLYRSWTGSLNPGAATPRDVA